MKCNNCKKTIPEVSILCPYCRKIVKSQNKEEFDFGEITTSSTPELKVYIKESKNKKVIVMAVIFMVIIISVFSLLVLSMFSKKEENEYQLFYDVIDNFSDYVVANYLGDNIVSSGKYRLNYTLNGVQSVFNGRYAYDLDNKVALLSGSMKDQAESTGEIILEPKSMNFDIYFEKNNLYFYSKEIYDDNILYNLEGDLGTLLKSSYSSEIIFNSLTNALMESFKYMNYENELVSINHRGKELEVNKKYVYIDNESKLKFITKFNEYLMNDTLFLKEVANFSEKNVDEIYELLANNKTNAEYKYSNESDLYSIFSIYYLGNDIYRIEFDRNNDINKDLYRLEIGDNKYYFDYFVEEKNKYSATLSLTTESRKDVYIKNYYITFDTDEFVMDVELYIEQDIDGKLETKNISSYKSINDFNQNDKQELNDDLKYYFEGYDFFINY